MNILVTGGSGFIGKNLIRFFDDEKYNFYVLGRKQDKSTIYVNSNSFDYYTTDYSEVDLISIFKKIKPNAVIHLAAKRASKKDKYLKKYFENIEITENLFKACKKVKISNIVNASTIAVYSSNNPIPWTESMTTFPMNYYGISKLITEKLAMLYSKKYDLSIKSLRFAQVVGIGERKGMLSDFLHKAQNGETINIYGKGSGEREYIYVKDVAKAIIAAIGKKDLTGIFNIGTGKRTSHKELAHTINVSFGNEGNIEFLEDKHEDKDKYQMDIKKAEIGLKWKPKWSLEKSLEDMKKDMRI